MYAVWLQLVSSFTSITTTVLDSIACVDAGPAASAGPNANSAPEVRASACF
jgi:hypothetical protein